MPYFFLSPYIVICLLCLLPLSLKALLTGPRLTPQPPEWVVFERRYPSQCKSEEGVR